MGRGERRSVLEGQEQLGHLMGYAEAQLPVCVCVCLFFCLRWIGEQGYFRILRGVNECAIEEMAVAVTPVFNN